VERGTSGQGAEAGYEVDPHHDSLAEMGEAGITVDRSRGPETEIAGHQNEEDDV